MGAHVIIVAAGMGKRFGGLKQFFKINKKPLLVYTIGVFEKCKKVKDIIVVTPEKRTADMQKFIRAYNIKKISAIVAGGRRRQDSVLAGLRMLKAKEGIVIIHDGVRPLVSQQLLGRGIKLCRKYKAVIFGLPFTDTVKHVLANRVLGTIPRKTLYTIQTPQFFDIDNLRSAYRKINFKKEFTDEASILESIGRKVFIFEGETSNIKVTTKQDMIFLRSFLK